MIAFVHQVWLLAQDAAAAAAGDPNAFFRLMLPLVVIMVLVLLHDDPAAEEERAGASPAWLPNLKENDHVVTIGGIHGVVTNVQRDAERVTIRVDESTGTKLRVNMSAIARVVTDDGNGKATAAGGKSK